MRYPALEIGWPEREACPDQYDEPSTLLCPGASRLILQVLTNAAYIQCGVMPRGKGAGLGSVQWQNEEPYVAGAAASLSRQFDAVRVRNWKAGSEAQVFVSVQ